MLRTAKMAKLYCVFPRGYADAVLKGLQELGLVQFFDVKGELGLGKPEVSTGSLLSLLQRVDVLLEALPAGRGGLLEKIFGAKSVPIKLTGKDEKMDLDNAAARLDALEREFVGLGDSELRDFAKRHHLELLALREELVLALDRLRALGKFGLTGYTLVFGCWVPKEEAERVERGLKRFTDDSCSIEIKPPGPGDSPPTHLRNPSLLRPFEVLATSYGAPIYGSIDPTPLLALTFTLFFGVMFADLGYGAVLASLNLLAFLKTRKAERIQRDLNAILFYCGLSAMLFGYLFGAVFGGLVELEHPPLGRHIHAVEHVLALALFLGVLHISISIASRFSEPAQREEFPYLLGLLAVLWSGAVLFLSGVADASPFIPRWVFFLAWASLFAGIAVLVRTKSIESFHELIALLANVISYSRIGVLATLHVTTAGLVANAIRALPLSPLGIVLGAIIFLSGAAFILVLGTFVSFVHSLRLHWLEFFKRFYSGFGESFKPFQAERRYTYVL